MTSTTAQAILAMANHSEVVPIGVQRAVLAALLPTADELRTLAQYNALTEALDHRDSYDSLHGVEYAAVMLDSGQVLGDETRYQVDEDGSIGLDPALAVEPERIAWDERARQIAEKMAQAELDAHAASVTS